MLKTEALSCLTSLFGALCLVVDYRPAPEVRGTSRLKAVAALGLGVVCFCLAPLKLDAQAAELERWTAGAVPKFVLRDTTGTAVALEAERGHVVLVHFFATWCEPCREELPALNRLTARANGSVKVLAIDVADADRRVQRFFEIVRADFPVLTDRDRVVAKAWQVATLPSTFVLDADLQPCFVVQADYAWDGIEPHALANLCAAKASATDNVSNR